MTSRRRFDSVALTRVVDHTPVASVLLALTTLLTTTSARGDLFIYSQQCVDPAWNAVCVTGACPEGSTEYSNNWGMTACGNAQLPGADDDVVIAAASVDQVLATIRSLTIADTATYRTTGTILNVETITNDGILSVLPASTP